jgi:membrane associated rhomboid family serine protease
MFILPIAKDNPMKSVPCVVIALIMVNSVLLIATYAGPGQQLFQDYGFIPAQTHVSTLFCSMFLHAGFWHLVGNMWFLWMFGNQVENMFGWWLFLPVYLLCGVGAAGLHYLFNPSSTIPCVGASGAISGIVGIYFVLFPRARFDLEIYLGWWHLKTIPARTQAAVGAWIGEQTLLGMLTQTFHGSLGVAFWAHVGGFLTGLLVAGLFILVVPRKTRRRALLAKPWYMQEDFKREEEHITQLKL